MQRPPPFVGGNCTTKVQPQHCMHNTGSINTIEALM